MAKYLVTGGAGFIGSNIVEELLRRGESVRVLDNLSTGKRQNILSFIDEKNFEFIEGDLRSYHIVQEAVKGIDYVLHQGALPSVPRSVKDPITTNDVNVNGTLNILDASINAGVKRVIFASSSSIYGNSQELPKSEDMKPSPESPYALTKYTGERYCQIFTKIHGLETVCLRYFNVFGPKQDPDSQYSAVIPKFIKLIKDGKSPVIYGDGEASRDFTFISNVVMANLLACSSDKAVGEVYNIACGESITINQLVQKLAELLHKEVKPVYAPARAGEVKHSYASIEKAKKDLGYNVMVCFNDGLAKLVESWQD